MTNEEYLARRDKILNQISQPQDVRGPGGTGVTFRSVDDLRKALAALDSDYAAQQGSASTSIFGRMYSGEGL